MRLWKRYWSVQVGTLLVENADLSVTFDVTKTSRREPNQCNISITNLNDRHVGYLSSADDPDVTVIAGYEDGHETIFMGDARDIWTETALPDRITRIEARDGGRAYRRTALERSFAPGASILTVGLACIEAMDVGQGNAVSLLNSATLNSGADNYATGTTLTGPAWRSFDRLVRSCGLRWSIQNGVVQIREPGRATTVQAVLLSSSTGLIGSPSRGKKNRNGRVTYTATSLMRPGIYPGRVVRVESKALEVNLLCKTTRHVGNTTDKEWYIEMELEEYA